MPIYRQTDLMSLYPVDPRNDISTSIIGSFGSSEIDLRQEFLKTIYGGPGEITKGMPVLIRRLRRDPITLARQRCTCVDPLTLEPDKDHNCPFCDSTGFYWDEEWWSCYKLAAGSETSITRRRLHWQSGMMTDDTYRFYFAYNANLLLGDEIIEVELDEEGNIAHPARRTWKWTPSTIEVKRLDRGRIEFFIASCAHSNAIYIDKSSPLSYINNP